MSAAAGGTGVRAKICGLSTPATVDAAVRHGAALVGFVFYPASPRAVSLDAAAALAARVPQGVERVGLVVDADDAFLDRLTATVPLELLQLHGSEPPARVLAIAQRSKIPVMKAIRVADRADLDAAQGFVRVAARLLFDAKLPAGSADPGRSGVPGGLPGGNGVAFDWSLLAGRSWPLPWMLSGGLDASNVAGAIRLTGATAVDVSSGVETSPGVKDADLIKRFLETVREG